MPNTGVSVEAGLQESDNFHSIWYTPTRVLLVFCNRKGKCNDIGLYLVLKGIVSVVHSFHQSPAEHPV